jgi:hypothetical protein
VRRLKEERGATAVIVAVLGLALIGSTALVVDLGAVHLERRELQNGADAAALAMAEDCARNLPSCGSDAAAMTWLDANASDGTSRLVTLRVDRTARRVTIRAGARDVSGTRGVPMRFASALGIRTKDVKATATASWGTAPASMPYQPDGTEYPSLPLTIDGCEFDLATAKGSVFGHPVVITFHGGGGGGGNGNQAMGVSIVPAKAKPKPTTSTTSTVVPPTGGGGGNGGGGTPKQPVPCATNASGQDAPGNFGWVEATGTCNADLDGIGEIGGDNGNNPPKDCSSAEVKSHIGKEIVLPIFRTASGNGSHMTYEITGFAAFHLTGFKLHGPPDWSYPAGAAPCGGGDRCIAGWFTRLTGAEAEPGGEDFGIGSIGLTADPAGVEDEEPAEDENDHDGGPPKDQEEA